MVRYSLILLSVLLSVDIFIKQHESIGQQGKPYLKPSDSALDSIIKLDLKYQSN